MSTILDEWADVAVPPAPEARPVAVDPARTALLVLDLQNQNCNAESRPRCVATLPAVRGLLAAARESGLAVIHSLTKTATTADIRGEVEPLPGEPVVRAGVDKFLGTELEGLLKARGVDTVIVVGTSAHGAVLHTATGAALRGYRVVVPVDGLSADNSYAEQYTCWHVANSPGTRRQAVLTRAELIQF